MQIDGNYRVEFFLQKSQVNQSTRQMATTQLNIFFRIHKSNSQPGKWRPHSWIFFFRNNIYPKSTSQPLKAHTHISRSCKRNLSTTIWPKKIKASRMDVNHSTYWWKRTQFVSFWKQLNFFHLFSNWFYVNQLTPLWKATQPFFSFIQYGNPL